MRPKPESKLIHKMDSNATGLRWPIYHPSSTYCAKRYIGDGFYEWVRLPPYLGVVFQQDSPDYEGIYRADRFTTSSVHAIADKYSKLLEDNELWDKNFFSIMKDCYENNTIIINQSPMRIAHHDSEFFCLLPGYLATGQYYFRVWSGKDLEHAKSVMKVRTDDIIMQDYACYWNRKLRQDAILHHYRMILLTYASRTINQYRPPRRFPEDSPLGSADINIGSVKVCFREVNHARTFFMGAWRSAIWQWYDIQVLAYHQSLRG